ncbi:hypothetical protein AYI68_g4621 [Smittium mucronatum]|uniref:Uncharacterized protein n=1 Tax=Smittium mucronatum TaxID=133383 RepID=A0A1R0GWJ9_9FUNG|nr:hypothetical protein AYI68_g4621 [Smittium mucronatum]
MKFIGFGRFITSSLLIFMTVVLGVPQGSHIPSIPKHKNVPNSNQSNYPESQPIFFKEDSKKKVKYYYWKKYSPIQTINGNPDDTIKISGPKKKSRKPSKSNFFIKCFTMDPFEYKMSAYIPETSNYGYLNGIPGLIPFSPLSSYSCGNYDDDFITDFAGFGKKNVYFKKNYRFSSRFGHHYDQLNPSIPEPSSSTFTGESQTSQSSISCKNGVCEKVICTNGECKYYQSKS